MGNKPESYPHNFATLLGPRSFPRRKVSPVLLPWKWHSSLLWQRRPRSTTQSERRNLWDSTTLLYPAVWDTRTSQQRPSSESTRGPQTRARMVFTPDPGSFLFPTRTNVATDRDFGKVSISISAKAVPDVGLIQIHRISFWRARLLGIHGTNGGSGQRYLILSGQDYVMRLLLELAG